MAGLTEPNGRSNGSGRHEPVMMRSVLSKPMLYTEHTSIMIRARLVKVCPG